MPRHKDRHHTDVLVEGDIIQHTYKGRAWKAQFTNNTFVDIDNPSKVYYTPTEFANAHLEVKTGVNGLRACKVMRGEKLTSIADLFVAAETSGSAPGTATATSIASATIESPPKPRLRLADMKRASSNVAKETVTNVAVAKATTQPKKKPAVSTQKKGAAVAAIAATIPPPQHKVLTPRVVESKEEPLDIFEFETIEVEECIIDGTKYFKEVSGGGCGNSNDDGPLIFAYDAGEYGPPVELSD